MRAVVYIALKDLRILGRDRGALFWVLAFPVLFSLFFGAVLRAGQEGSMSPLPVVVVSEARTEAGARLLRALESSQGLQVIVGSLDEARAAVRRAEAIAWLRIHPNFGGGPAQLDSAPITLAIDPSRRTEAAFLEPMISEVAARALAPRAAASPQTQRLVSSAFAEKGAPRSAYQVVLPAAILWGLMGCAAAFAISLVSERTAGTLLRLRAAPVSRTALLGGKALACFLACALDALLLVCLAHFVLAVPIASVTSLLVAVLCACACFSGITLALSVLGRTEQSVAGAGWATLIVMAMLGGAMVPLSLMPEWLQAVSQISPVRWGILALEGATWREFGSTELLKPCAILLSVGIVAFVGGVSWMSKAEA
ncbi:MAG TPA: ABC transporter permease [Polyangiaceae bacterium]